MNDYNYMFDYYQNINDYNNNNFLYPNPYPTNEPIKLDSEKGFMRGNMFDDLYDQYKNYIPVEIVSNNNRQALLEKVMQYNFAMTDLNLYLDNYPNDANVIKIFNNYRNKYLNAVKDFLHLNFSVLPVILLFVLGVVLGVALASKGIHKALERFRPQMIYLIIGLMLGSIYAVMQGPTSLDVPREAMDFSTFHIGFFLLGGAIIVGLQKLSDLKIFHKKK